MTISEILSVFVPAVVVPAVVLAMNWAFRYERGYSQTAPADFLLAVLVFDGAAISTSEAFAPLVVDSDLRAVVVQWHILMGAVCLLVWWLVLNFAEPRLAEYYSDGKTVAIAGFPVISFIASWMAIFALTCVHVLFFVFRS